MIERFNRMKPLNCPLLAADAVYYLAAIVCGVVVVWALYMCHFGVDTTDEGYYLYWISQPFDYAGSTTQFGYVYHPLFLLLNGDIVLLRQFNIAITMLLACGLSYCFLMVAFDAKCWRLTSRLIVSGVLASNILMLFGNWLPIPNYNTLNFQAILVASIGLLLADRDDGRASISGWVLIAVGGWLDFMAKPTSAALLAILAVCYLCAAGKLRLKWILLCAVTTLILLLLSAWAISGSVTGFVDHLVRGAADVSLIGGGHSLSDMLRLDDVLIEPRTSNILLYGTLAISVLVLSAYTQSRIGYRFAVFYLIVILLSIVVFVVRGEGVGLNATFYHGIWSWITLIACVLVSIVLHISGKASAISRRKISLFGVLFLIPYVYVFGSNNNYWGMSAHAAFFWVLAALVLVIPAAGRPAASSFLVLCTGVAAQLITVVLVGNAMVQPYRGIQPLIENDVVFPIGRAETPLVLERNQAAYLRQLKELVTAKGFKYGTPVIDLSGHSPGVLYMIGADSVASPWLIGGYPGSNELAERQLSRVSCDRLASAWVLTENSSSLPLSLDLMNGFGASLEDYDLVGSVRSPGVLEGVDKGGDQLLYSPKREHAQAVSRCVAAQAQAQLRNMQR